MANTQYKIDKLVDILAIFEREFGFIDHNQRIHNLSSQKLVNL